MRRSRIAWGAVLAVLVVLLVIPVAYLATSSTADAVLEQRQEQRAACPSQGRRLRPSDIHLEPSLVQHQNWIEFSVPQRFAGYYALCFDDRLLNTGGGRLDSASGIWRFHVATRSVDLYWLSGSFDGLRDPNRWELRLMCDQKDVCQ